MLIIPFEECRSCEDFSCTAACPYEALAVCGYEIDARSLTETLEKDRPFFGEEGGVTITGGEPFAQADFLVDVLQRCKSIGISTAVESCLYAPFQDIERALPFIDFFMFDVKHMDAHRHRILCGLDNSIILENIDKLCHRARMPLLPRMPVIPSINDSRENVQETVRFLKSLGLGYINLLPYMKLGIDKYKGIGERYLMEDTPVPAQEHLNAVVRWIEDAGISCL